MVGTAVRKVLLAITAATAALLFAAGCASAAPSASPSVTASPLVAASTAPASPTSTPTPTANTLGSLTGAWRGTWINESPQRAVGTFTLTWAQQGNLLVGAIGVAGSDCISDGDVTGNVDGDKISFGAVKGNVPLITYVGTITGNMMSGTYTSDCGNSKGTWQAIKA